MANVQRITWTSAGYAALVNDDNTGTREVRVAEIALGSGTTPAAKSDTGLENEVKRIGADNIAGKPVDNNIIHVVVRDESKDAYTVREYGLYADDGTFLGRYAQSETIIEKAAGSTLLLISDAALTDVVASQISFPSIDFINPPWGENTQGVVQKATDAIARAMADNSRGMTARLVKAAITSFFGGAAGAGPGKNLNADLLDDQHGAFYLQSIAPKQLDGNDDLNSVTGPGWYAWAGTAPKHAPDTYAHMLVVSNGTFADKTQIVWVGYKDQPIVYTRNNPGAKGWKGWARNIDETGGTYTGRVRFGGDGQNGGSPTIAAAIGDNDSGLHYVSDGVWELWSNGKAIARISDGGDSGFIAYRGIGLEGKPVYLRTASDASHTLGYNSDIDGGVLDGYSATALSVRAKRRVTATTSGVLLSGTATFEDSNGKTRAQINNDGVVLQDDGQGMTFYRGVRIYMRPGVGLVTNDKFSYINDQGVAFEFWNDANTGKSSGKSVQYAATADNAGRLGDLDPSEYARRSGSTDNDFRIKRLLFGNIEWDQLDVDGRVGYDASTGLAVRYGGASPQDGSGIAALLDVRNTIADKGLSITGGRAANSRPKISLTQAVARTGNYGDLSGRPSIPSKPGDVGAAPYGGTDDYFHVKTGSGGSDAVNNDALAQANDDLFRKIMDSTYPVDKIVWLNTKTNPADKFSMPWSKWQRHWPGRFLISADDDHDLNATGGQYRVTLQRSESPPVTVRIPKTSYSATDIGKAFRIDSTNQQGTLDVDTDGGGNSHENMPPWAGSYVWVRKS